MTESSTENSYFVTTHTGSLPHRFDQQRIAELLRERANGQPFDGGEFADLAAEAVDDAVAMQQRIGIDIVSSGEVDRAGFLDAARLTNFDGPATSAFIPLDLANAGMLEGFASSGAVLPRMNSGPVEHDPAPITAELDRFLTALDRHGISRSRAFLPAPSPSVIANQGSTYYDDEEKFLQALTAALRQEYLAVAGAGLTLQIDAPDLAMDFFVWHRDEGTDKGIARLARHVQVINEATEGIPAEQLRVHVCNGNWPGPHNYDVTLPEIIDTLYGLRAGTLLLELSNPRHRWENKIFGPDGHPLPPGKTLGAGVVDSGSMNVEHALTVKAALLDLLEVTGVGADRIMATPDCGFRTLLGLAVLPQITELKLLALAEGARLAREEAQAAAD